MMHVDELMLDNELARQDQQAAQQLAQEREEACIAAIWHAAMLGLPEDECRLLCDRCGVSWDKVRPLPDLPQ